MSNCITNILKMQGITKLPLFSPGEDGLEFDFNCLIPMPTSLDIEAGGKEELAIVYYLTEKCSVPADKLPNATRKLLRKTVGYYEETCKHIRSMRMADDEQVKLYEMGRVYVSNITNYGFSCWYPWCYHNWGTKWNAWETQKGSADVIRFFTANSPPIPIIKKLAEKYPEQQIDLWWIDDGWCLDKRYGTVADHAVVCADGAFAEESNCPFPIEISNLQWEQIALPKEE